VASRAQRPASGAAGPLSLGGMGSRISCSQMRSTRPLYLSWIGMDERRRGYRLKAVKFWTSRFPPSQTPE
jgi:hypothetical protein